MTENCNGVREIQCEHLDDARRELPVRVTVDPWHARFFVKTSEGLPRYISGGKAVEGIRCIEARQHALKVFSYRAAPCMRGLVVTGGGNVPQSEFTFGVIDSMTGVHNDFEPHLGKDFARDSSEIVRA